MPPLFSAGHLGKRCGGQPAVNDLSFAVAPGECLGVDNPMDMPDPDFDGAENRLAYALGAFWHALALTRPRSRHGVGPWRNASTLARTTPCTLPLSAKQRRR